MFRKDWCVCVCGATISLVLSGKRWSHLKLSVLKVKKPRLSEEVKHQIIDLQTQGYSQNQIAERLNINQSTVSRILRGT